jgi:outer membrane protein TolC
MIQLEKQIPLQEVKVRQTFENYELAEGRYYVGLGDYIELQDAKVNYNNAQRAYIETIYKYNVARANLESVIALPQKVTMTLEDFKNGRKK